MPTHDQTHKHSPIFLSLHYLGSWNSRRPNPVAERTGIASTGKMSCLSHCEHCQVEDLQPPSGLRAASAASHPQDVLPTALSARGFPGPVFRVSANKNASHRNGDWPSLQGRRTVREMGLRGAGASPREAGGRLRGSGGGSLGGCDASQLPGLQTLPFHHRIQLPWGRQIVKSINRLFFL